MMSKSDPAFPVKSLGKIETQFYPLFRLPCVPCKANRQPPGEIFIKETTCEFERLVRLVYTDVAIRKKLNPDLCKLRVYHSKGAIRLKWQFLSSILIWRDLDS